MNKPVSTVVITRPVTQSKRLEALFKEKHLEPLLMPAIAIERVALTDQIRAVLSRLQNGEFAWLVFTSMNGVRALHALQVEAYGSASLPEALKVAVQGEKTGKCFKELYQRLWDLMPDQFVSTALVESLSAEGVEGKKILLATAEETTGVLLQGVQAAGAQVEELIVYATKPVRPDQEMLAALENQAQERLIFTFFSPSAFHSTLAFLGDRHILLEQVRIASIGPVTTEAISAAGLSVWCEAKEQTEEGLARAVCEALSGTVQSATL